jgi:hypothetical protein
MGTAGGTVQQACDAWGRYVRERGSTAWGDLIDAIILLLDYVPKSLVVDGQYLVKDGVTVNQKLTPKEAVFLQRLIQAKGKPVTDDEFDKHGIKRTDLLKSRLLAKSGFRFLRDHITRDSGLGYRLIY